MDYPFIRWSEQLTDETIRQNFSRTVLMQQLEVVGRLSFVPEPERRMHSEENAGNYLRRSNKGRLERLSSYVQSAEPLKLDWLSFRTDRTHGKIGHY